MGEEVYCYHCKKEFYLNNFRFQVAKTVSCIFCGKRIDKLKSQKLKTNGGAIPPITKVMGLLAIFL